MSTSQTFWAEPPASAMSYPSDINGVNYQEASSSYPYHAAPVKVEKRSFEALSDGIVHGQARTSYQPAVSDTRQYSNQRPVETTAPPVSRFQQLLNAKLAAEQQSTQPQHLSVPTYNPLDAMSRFDMSNTVLNTSFSSQYYNTPSVSVKQEPMDYNEYSNGFPSYQQSTRPYSQYSYPNQETMPGYPSPQTHQSSPRNQGYAYDAASLRQPNPSPDQATSSHPTSHQNPTRNLYPSGQSFRPRQGEDADSFSMQTPSWLTPSCQNTSQSPSAYNPTYMYSEKPKGFTPVPPVAPSPSLSSSATSNTSIEQHSVPLTPVNISRGTPRLSLPEHSPIQPEHPTKTHQHRHSLENVSSLSGLSSSPIAPPRRQANASPLYEFGASLHMAPLSYPQPPPLKTERIYQQNGPRYPPFKGGYTFASDQKFTTAASNGDGHGESFNWDNVGGSSGTGGGGSMDGYGGGGMGDGYSPDGGDGNGDGNGGSNGSGNGNGKGNGDGSGSGGDGGGGNGHSSGSKKLVLACHFCRGRKLKCDGIRPTCAHCAKRHLECSYDQAVRRRGPGKRTKEMRQRAQREAVDLTGMPVLMEDQSQMHSELDSSQMMENDDLPGGLAGLAGLAGLVRDLNQQDPNEQYGGVPVEMGLAEGLSHQQMMLPNHDDLQGVLDPSLIDTRPTTLAEVSASAENLGLNRHGLPLTTNEAPKRGRKRKSEGPQIMDEKKPKLEGSNGHENGMGNPDVVGELHDLEGLGGNHHTDFDPSMGVGYDDNGNLVLTNVLE